MAQQEEGWPLGLQPLNVRVGLVRNRGLFASASFNTSLSSSLSSSTDSSSDLDTESTGSFFHDRSITLGRLMGISSMRRRSIRGRKRPEVSSVDKKAKTCCFSLCPGDSTDAESVNNVINTPSLGQFLEVERRAADEHGRSHSPLICGPDEVALAQPDSGHNSLFVNGCIAPPPPRSSPWFGSDVGRRENRGLEHGDGKGVPVLLSCICGQTFSLSPIDD